MVEEAFPFVMNGIKAFKHILITCQSLSILMRADIPWIGLIMTGITNQETFGGLQKASKKEINAKD